MTNFYAEMLMHKSQSLLTCLAFYPSIKYWIRWWDVFATLLVSKFGIRSKISMTIFIREDNKKDRSRGITESTCIQMINISTAYYFHQCSMQSIHYLQYNWNKSFLLNMYFALAHRNNVLNTVGFQLFSHEIPLTVSQPIRLFSTYFVTIFLTSTSLIAVLTWFPFTI